MRSLLMLAVAAFTAITGCKAPQSEECVYKECQCTDTLAVTPGKHYAPFNKNYRVVAYEYAGSQQAQLLRLDTGNVFDSASIKMMHVLSADEVLQLELICKNRKQVCNDYTCEDGNDCGYQPHHCIVFYEGDGKPAA